MRKVVATFDLETKQEIAYNAPTPGEVGGSQGAPNKARIRHTYARGEVYKVAAEGDVWYGHAFFGEDNGDAYESDDAEPFATKQDAIDDMLNTSN